MSETPKLSVVIPHWSWGPAINVALGENVARCAIGTHEVLVMCGGPLPSGGSSIGININRGLKAATGDFILVMNNDLLPRRGHLTDLCVDENTVGSPMVNAVAQPFHGCAFCIPRRALDVVGYFDTDNFEGYFEDEDYCLRLRRAGFRLQSIPSVSFDHLEGGGSSMSRIDAARLYEQSRTRFFTKWGADVEDLATWMARQA